MAKNKELANITRIDQEAKPPKRAGQHGWWVRIQRRGEKYHNFFNDGKFGGKDKSLEAAKVFRDAVTSQYFENPNTEQMLAGERAPSNRNKSGVIGVNRTDHKYTRRGKIYRRLVWQAHWPIGNGRYANKAFSILRHGEEEAFRLALQARQDALAKIQRAVHPALVPPANKKQKLWRYMDFTKFMSLLEEGALYFSCVALLDDPFEGSFSKLNKALRPLIYKGKDPAELSHLIVKLRNEVAVNCWHASDYESAAMWELYAKSEESVCIQTTYEKLSLALEGKAEIGTVQYVDYTDEFIPENDPYLAFLHKRKSFEHEREIRGIIRKLDEKDAGHGTLVKIDVTELIDIVYVSPSSPRWFYELISKTMKRYGLTKPVIQSSLADDPVY